MPRLDKLFGSKTPGLTPLWRGSVADHLIDLAWSPCSTTVAAAAVSGLVRLFKVNNGAILHELSGHNFGTTALAWQPNGQILASAGQDGKVRLWNPENGQVTAELDGGAAWVERLAWKPDGQVLASGAGRKIRLFAKDGQRLYEYPTQPGTILGLAWEPNGGRLASAVNGHLSFWDVDSPAPLRQFQWKGAPLALAWSPDSRFIAAGEQDCTVHLWFVDSGQDLQMHGYPTKPLALSWDSTARFLATSGSDVVTIWDCSGVGPEGRKPLMLEGHTEFVSAVAYQRKSDLLISGGADARLALWQPSKRKSPLAQAYLDGEITRLAWSPDERLLAAGTTEGTLALFRVG